MSKALLGGLSQAQRERLFHIDFKLRFLGTLNRNDLVERFGIKEAAATRDIKLYRDIADKNLNYNSKIKAYTLSKKFKPLFEYPCSQALLALCEGLGDDQASVNGPLILAEAPTHLNTPNLDTLAATSRAIHQGRALEITYRSLSSGRSTRVITPFALVDNGLRWHVRAYDRKRKHFGDFVINRMEKAKILEGAIEQHESKEADKQWNRIVELHIAPHPRLKHPETIEEEYGMENGMLVTDVRAAVAGYVLRRWNVDCSVEHELDGPEYHLCLVNLPTLYGVQNLAIAPGYVEG